MLRPNSHLSDEDLLRALDSELTGGEMVSVTAHLEACWECRARRGEFERTIADYVRAKRETEATLPSIEGPRAVLRARLNAARQAEAARGWLSRIPGALTPRRIAYTGAALGAILLTVFALYFGVAQVRAASVPDAALTPGVTREVSLQDICLARAHDGFYPIPATLAYRVFEKYRIRNPRPRSYEVDYLITPRLGGADDIRNLWPQPYASGEWNAHVKDALEDRLHGLVCAGQLDLETAQHDLAMDWIAAYRKYFNTDRPLPDHAAFSVDPPWED